MEKQSQHQQGKWIWMDEKPAVRQFGRHQLVYFRRSFELSAAEAEMSQLHIRVSADSRYRLYLNGASVAIGPCKGDAATHYYEEVDLSAYLRAGSNVLAAKVLHYSPFGLDVDGYGGPASIWRSQWGAFLLDGAVQDGTGNLIESLHTDERWVCLADRAITFVPSFMETLYVGGMERVNGGDTVPGWQDCLDGSANNQPFDWRPARIVSAVADPTYGHLTPWRLAPRPIPALYETSAYFKSVTRLEGAESGFTFYQNPEDAVLQALEVPAGAKVVVELDAGELTTGYPVLELLGGRDSQIKLLYAECYESGKPEAINRRVKGKRDDASGILVGEYDCYKVGGFGNGEIYEPFWFRTFRYIRLEIATADEPLRLCSFSYRETGYPLDIKASFKSSDETLTPLWEISARTLQRCMHETYEDCPYYEQLQYTMDTRLQALFTYVLSADDRLARKAIYDFHSSRLPDGMLQSRYPSVSPQVIPGFSLYWVMMVHDHYLHYGDEALVRAYLSTVDGVLQWFDSRIDSLGLVGKMPEGYWPFVDWVEEWRERAGVPAAHEAGAMTVYNFMYATALGLAAELNESVGRVSTGAEYRARADAICQAANQRCWSKDRKIYQDGPGLEQYSQHCQIWAVLCGAVEGEEARRILDVVMTDGALSKVSYAMAFFQFRALAKAGMYDRSFGLWDTWRELAALNLTTWVEDPVSQRSDCHAWGAVPLYEFTTEILGVQSGGPGYSRIRIAPTPGPLKSAEGAVAIPQGVVLVSWQRTADDRFELSCEVPAGTEAEIRLPSGDLFMIPEGKHQFSCELTERQQ
ncbi:hypothetical protein PA598K_06189 [Paenibacillus sp. 598K]|uniref:alpha-L-rhamnosidase-related protein n=1 Tax=Paenibacillus sp. 598K TaxID=1117987 RepID=UPI000FFA74E6|nr:alpha-L-rhamnosidase C-terminal domain-containing protein [Paenibacillus sp. 598K]GBF77632.1 hypothetical protein PA598K_06189 [Paenibacillus sp. 598K]